MKRWRRPRPLILITLLLLAGAVVNVAVAWTASIARWLEHRQVYPWPATDRGWHDESPPHWPAFGHEDGGVVGYRRGLGWRWVHQEVEWARQSQPVYFRRYQLDRIWAGWPANSLSRTTHVEVTTSKPIATLWRAPTRPLPAGFLVNTLFYATVLALPLSFCPIRRRLRARRGRCPKCGYNLAGLGAAEKGAEGAAPCPECGATR